MLPSEYGALLCCDSRVTAQRLRIVSEPSATRQLARAGAASGQCPYGPSSGSYPEITLPSFLNPFCLIRIDDVFEPLSVQPKILAYLGAAYGERKSSGY
jgi:hypothetical protein